jgi:hypothetical protein
MDSPHVERDHPTARNLRFSSNTFNREERSELALDHPHRRSHRARARRSGHSRSRSVVVTCGVSAGTKTRTLRKTRDRGPTRTRREVVGSCSGRRPALSPESARDVCDSLIGKTRTALPGSSVCLNRVTNSAVARPRRLGAQYSPRFAHLTRCGLRIEKPDRSRLFSALSVVSA